MKKTINDLKRIYDEQHANLHQRENKKGFQFKVAMGESGRNAGAKEILRAVCSKDLELKTDVTITQREEYKEEFKLPVVEVIDNKHVRYIYAGVTEETALRIFEEHAFKEKVCKDLLTKEVKPGEEE